MSRVCLITGGTRGIGYAVAEALLRAGDTVAITGTTNDGVIKAEHALASHGQVVGIVADVRDPGAIELAMRTVVSRFGGLDVLINCAGVGVGAPVSDLPHDEWDRIIGINLTGVFNCCRAAIPHLRTRGGGWIINISSLSSTGPFPGGAAYVASKAGVNAFSDALMQELRYDNIRVSYIMPGSVAAGFSSNDESKGADWKIAPADIADVVLNLLRHHPRSLPSRVEIRPSKPRK